MSGNQKVRYRETKFVDVFGDVTVDFGVILPTPVPTARDPFDPYYRDKAIFIKMQTEIWAEDLGIEQAVQKAVDWINGEVEVIVDDLTIPLLPPEGVSKAVVDDNDPTKMWIIFTDGMSRFISFQPIIIENTLNSQSLPQKQSDKKVFNKLKGIPTTVNSNKVIILEPFFWQWDYTTTSVSWEIYNDLNETGVYEINRKLVTKEQVTEGEVFVKGRKVTAETIDAAINSIEVHWNDPNYYKNDPDDPRYIENYASYLIKIVKGTRGSNYKTSDEFCGILNSTVIGIQEQIDHNFPDVEFLPDDVENVLWTAMEEIDYIVTDVSLKDPINTIDVIGINDFRNLASSGVIYIHTHGFDDSLACGALYTNTPEGLYDKDPSKMYDEIHNLHGTWCIGEVPMNAGGAPYNMEVYSLTKNFFIDQNFSNSIVYLNACRSWTFSQVSSFSSAKAYLGNTASPSTPWHIYIAYYFFRYMIEGYEQPVAIFEKDIVDPNSLPEGPMSVQKAIATLRDVKGNIAGKEKHANPDPIEGYTSEVKYGGQNLDEEDVYFPVPVNIIVHEE